MRKSESIIRDALAEMLDLISYKVRSGSMSEDDVKSILSIIHSGGGIKATIKDLASFYGQSEDNVRHVIHRGFMPKPERRVYFDFKAFRELVPEKWHHRHSLPAD